MDKAAMAHVEVALQWSSARARHAERQYLERVNFWRDLFPGDLGERVAQSAVGEVVAHAFAAGELVPAHDPVLVRRVRAAQFRRSPKPGLVLAPRVGRFYPLDLLEGLAGFYPQDRRPFRILQADGDSLSVDINHPFARFSGTLEAKLVEVLDGREERGGRCTDVGQHLTEYGPGFQAPLAEGDTDFYSDDAFARLDPRPDGQFYGKPRFVQHLDALARAQVASLYERFLRPGDRVLDLMSSWVSHLPDSPQGLQVTGLGLNQDELDCNERLSTRVVHDLNAAPQLPFGASSFDAMVCTVSVEYLVRPFQVFAEAARVLKPGGVFVTTFSERWFPTKVVQSWTELHPFERMGLVLDYFHRAGFVDLGTESIRGWPRPEDDPYAQQLPHADPLYAVWGRAPR